MSNHKNTQYVTHTCRSLPFPGRVLFSAWWTRWMGVSSGLESTLSKLALLPCSTRAGTLGPVRASSNFLTNLKRVLRKQNISRTILLAGQPSVLLNSPSKTLCPNEQIYSTNQISYRWVFSTDCLMDQKLTSFHLEILTKSWGQQITQQWSLRTLKYINRVSEYWYRNKKGHLNKPWAPSRWAVWADWSWSGCSQRTGCSICAGSTKGWTIAL